MPLALAYVNIPVPPVHHLAVRVDVSVLCALLSLSIIVILVVNWNGNKSQFDPWTAAVIIMVISSAARGSSPQATAPTSSE